MGDIAAADGSVLSKGAGIGRYVVLGLIGRGGMGEVYAAFDPELDRKIAVKLLRGHASRGNDLEGRVRLLREAQAIARLSHPNVVVVYDVGTFEDQVFIAMEFVDGNTVGYWMKAAPRTWQETSQVFMAAGRGLAAAHAAGMVHRDFKPDNVMLTRDGQVRVMDFGLARQLAEKEPPAQSAFTSSGQMQDLINLGDAPRDEPELAQAPAEEPDLDATAELGASPRRAALPAPSGNYLKQQLTQTGALVGTPAYMAPEQFAAAETDARTDQFSFCVALYEALYGERPFDGDSLVSLMANVVSGTIRAERPSAKVPARVRKVLLRGLEADPTNRYPSMAELLADLAPPAAPRTRPLVVALALVAVAASAVVAVRQITSTSNALCAGAPARLAGVWGLPGASARKDAIRRQFEAGAKGGGRLFEGVSKVLDAYVARWAAMYRDSCEATNLRREQSTEVMDLRMACLGERLTSVRAVTDILANADTRVLENAVSAAASLPSLERCADVAMLRSVIQPPKDETAHRRVDELRAEVARVRALSDAGKCAEALAAGRVVLAAARSVDYLPLVAEASYVVGHAGNYCGDPASAVSALEDAVWSAETSRHDEVAVEAAAFVGGLEAEHARDASLARHWLSYADAILMRLPGHPLLEAYVAIAWGTLLQSEGNDVAALNKQLSALALKEHSLGPLHPDTALSASNVGLALHEMGRDAEADEYSKRAVDTLEQLLGRDGSQVAFVLLNRGEILTGLGRLDEARTSLERAIQIWTATDPKVFFVPYAQHDLARVALAQGRFAEARRLAEGVLDILEKADRIGAGETRAMLAQALWATPRERSRALSLAAAAREELVAAGAPARKIADVDAWLREHRSP